MKPILFFLLILLLSATQLRAQDNIIMRTGEEIKAKVDAVGISSITYKRTDNPAGPVYTTSKRDVFMIQYANGTKDVFGTVPSPAQPYAKSPDNPSLNSLPDYDRLRHIAARKIAGGVVMVAVGAPVLISGITLLSIGASDLNSYRYYNNYNGYNYPDNNNSSDVGLVVGGTLMMAVGLVLEVVGPITIRGGVLLRRKAREIKPASLGFAPISNPLLDHYTRAMNTKTLGALTFTF